MIDKGLCYEQKTGFQQKGQATFYVVAWDEMITQKLTIKVWKQ